MSGKMPQSLVNTALFLSNQELLDFDKLYPDYGGHVVCASPCLGGLLDQLSDN